MPRPNIWISIALAAAAVCANAQWVNHPTPGIPRTKDGKPNLTAPAPRAPDGKPDLSGIWEAEPATREELLRRTPDGVNFLGEDSVARHFMNILADFKPEEAPIRPAALEVFRKHAATGGADFSATHCLPLGLPVAESGPEPHQIIQTPNSIVFLYEADMTFRQIYLDGRTLPVDPQPTWLGYSVGKWEGDVLLVNANGFTDQSWLDASGHPHSEAMRLTERFRRIDFGHMEIQITVDDPENYTKPFTFVSKQRLRPDTDILEFVCSENEKDQSHYGKK